MRKRTYIIVAYVEILFFTALNCSSFFIARARTPPGYMYAGDVHFPTDYFFYLSLMAQGKERWLSSLYLQGGEHVPPMFTNWFLVLAGHLYSLLNINNVIGYQIFVGVATALFLFLTYRLLVKIFLQNALMAIAAFTLFLFSDEFPILKLHPFKLDFIYEWYNYGSVFQRLTNTPSHALMNALTIGFLLLAARWFAGNLSYNKKVFLMAGIVSMSFILASIQPVYWLLGVMSVCVVGTISWIADRQSNKRSKLLVDTLIPAICAVIGGLIPTGYYLFSIAGPYQLAKVWEQQIYNIKPTFMDFISINGPVFIAAIPGLWFFLKNKTPAARLLSTFSFLSLGIYVSPLPAVVGIGALRFLSPVHVLFFAACAAYAVAAFAKLAHSKKSIVFSISILLMISMTLPTTWRYYNDRNKDQLGNAMYYLPNSAMEIFSTARNSVAPNQTSLVIWPFNESFPAFTGRKTFYANAVDTTEYTKKEIQATEFFNDQMSAQEMIDFLKNYSISYVIAYRWTPKIADLPGIQKIVSNGYMALYRVN